MKSLRVDTDLMSESDHRHIAANGLFIVYQHDHDAASMMHQMHQILRLHLCWTGNFLNSAILIFAYDHHDIYCTTCTCGPMGPIGAAQPGRNGTPPAAARPGLGRFPVFKVR